MVLMVLRMTLRTRPREYTEFPKGANLRPESRLRTCMPAAGSASAGRGKMDSAVLVRIISYLGNNHQVHVEPPRCVLTSVGRRRPCLVCENSSKTGCSSEKDLGYLTTIPVPREEVRLTFGGAPEQWQIWTELGVFVWCVEIWRCCGFAPRRGLLLIDGPISACMPRPHPGSRSLCLARLSPQHDATRRITTQCSASWNKMHHHPGKSDRIPRAPRLIPQPRQNGVVAASRLRPLPFKILLSALAKCPISGRNATSYADMCRASPCALPCILSGYRRREGCDAVCARRRTCQSEAGAQGFMHRQGPDAGAKLTRASRK